MPSIVPWTADQVRAVAPDSASMIAARRLARSRGWIELGVGAEPAILWGLCQSSGTKPYQTCVDLTDVAYRCSCPSRKSPCKHALALLLRWSEGAVPSHEPPAWAIPTAKPQKRPAGLRTPAQEQAAQRRAETRLDRVLGGAADLHQWVADQIEHGIAGLDRAGYGPFEQMATRMIDAQAPGLAGMVRRLAGIPNSGKDWESRMLAELSLLHLLTGAAARLDELPPDLAATVRSRLGQSLTTEQVLATAPVRDTWQVIGVRDFIEERLSTRRVWLVGRETGREALVLSFAPPGQPLAGDLLLGTSIDADAHFHAGAAPRATLATRHGPAFPCPEPWPVLTVPEALDRLAAALACDPWLGSWPMLVRGCVVPGEKWSLVDDSGWGLPLPGTEWWDLVGAAGGMPTTLAVEWSAAGVTPLTAFAPTAVVAA